MRRPTTCPAEEVREVDDVVEVFEEDIVVLEDEGLNSNVHQDRILSILMDR